MEHLEQSNGPSPIMASASRSYVADSPQPVFVGAPARNGAKGMPHTPQTTRATRTISLSPMLRAMQSAMESTSTSIAEATRQPADDVRSQLQQLTDWLSASLAADAPADMGRPPIVPRDYIAALRKNLLLELDGARGLVADDVVRVLLKVDEAAEGWKRTDRGKFISRLTGSDCADAVVAIAHDIRDRKSVV